MSFWLFNPPEPHCSPTTKIVERTQPLQQNFCGACPAVPRYWKLTCNVTSGNPNAEIFAGNFILSRDESTFLHDQSVNLTYPCSWLALAADKQSTIEFGFFGNADNGQNVGNQWFANFNLSGFTHPAIYSLYAAPAGQDPRPFRCLSPNTLWLTDSGDIVGLGGSQILPSSILVQPFWP